jgi:hypothetical protein
VPAGAVVGLQELADWQAAVQEWFARGDKSVIMPEVAPTLMQALESIKDNNDEARETWKFFQTYVRNREAQIARLKGSGGSPVPKA